MKFFWGVVFCGLSALSQLGWAQEKAPLNASLEAVSAYAAAQIAISQGDWSQAELHLERTLMFAPNHAEARLDLALLLASRGRAEAAEAFVNSLLADPRTPAAHRARLQALLTQLNLPAAPVALLEPMALKPAWVRQMGVSLSAQTNPLAGTSDSEVTLTLTDGEIRLPIDAQDRSAPVVDSFITIQGADGLRLEAQAQQVMGAVDRFAGRVLLQHNSPLAPSLGFIIGVQLQKSHFDEQRRSAFLGRLGESQRMLLSFYDEPRTGRRAWVGRLDWQGLRPSHVLFAEHEWALGSGPSQSRFGTQHSFKMTEKTTAYGSALVHLDHQGYSPFLRQDAPRRMVTAQIALEHRLGQNLGVRLHQTRRWSNIELFGFKDLGITLQVRHQW